MPKLSRFVQYAPKNAPSGGGSSALGDITGTTAYQTLYVDSAAVIRELPHGTSGYVLTSNGASSNVSWQAASGGLADIVDDVTPQLGGQLDINGNAIGDGTLELLTFTETASAVNQVNVANAATGGAPVLSAVGDDTNIGLTLTPKGTGNITLGTMVFNSDQTIAAGQDNYVLTYDNGTGLISLEAAAGGGGLSNVVEDVTPQLGANLDVNDFSITSATNGDVLLDPHGSGTLDLRAGSGGVSIITNAGNSDITINPHGTGNVLLGTMEFDSDQTIGAGQDNYVLTYDNAAGLISLEAAAGGGGLTQFEDNSLVGEGLYDTDVVFRTSAGGIDVADSSGDDPIISWYRDSTFATRTAYINTNNVTSHMTFLSSQTSGHMLFYAADNTGVAGLVFEIDPDTSTDLYYDGSNVLQTQPQGIYIASSTADADPFIGFYSTDAFSSRSGYIQCNNVTGLIIEQEIHGLPITLQSEDNGGTVRQLFVGDPDGDVELYNNANLAFLTTSVGAAVQHPISTSPRLDLRTNSGTRVASFEANTTITKIKSVIHGGNVNLTGENTAGTEQILFAGDPDGPAELYYDGSLVLSTQSGGILVQDDSGNVADIDFAGSTGTALGRLVATTTSFSFGASQNSASVSMTSLSSAAVSRFLFLGDPDGESQMYRTGTAVLGTASLGAFVRDSAGDNPLLRMESNAGVVAGWLYFGATGGYIRNYQNGTNWRFLMNDAGGTSQTIIDMDGDIGLGFNGQSAFAAPTYVANATAVLDRTLLASASATTTNNNNVLAALIADLQSYGLLV